jgi:ribonuclease BN (tRNA processing enzyme)
VELVVLGSGGGWARPGGAACGYLVRHGGFNLWVDLGTGTMANIQRHIGLGDVHAVAVSHRHFDHFLDLYPFYLAEWYTAEREPIPLFVPPEMFEHAAQLEPDLRQGFDVAVVTPGETFEAGPIVVRTARMNHPVPTLGMRFEADGAVLVYSADTGPCQELIDLATGAQVLLSEATWIDRPEWAEEIHLTATQAGDHAARAQAGHLVLTHIWPSYDVAVSQERASQSFGAPVQIAKEHMRILIDGSDVQIVEAAPMSEAR